MPRGFERQVNRMREAQREKDAIAELAEKKLKGEQFDRVKLAKVKPPQFAEAKKKSLLLYVDVNVTPTKMGRIGIHEGDDLRDLAKNFCRTFSLNKGMYDALLSHLQQSV